MTTLLKAQDFQRSNQVKHNQKGPWIVYVLACEHNTYYIGRTKNLIRRIEQHELGTAVEFTKIHKPEWLCVYWENASVEKEYYILDAFIKVWGKDKIGGANYYEQIKYNS